MDVEVLSSIATREAYLELVPQFERETGSKVLTTWSGTTDIMKRMAAGETYDLVIVSSVELEKLIEQGRIQAGSRTDIATCGIGVAVAKGAPKPDIGSADRLKQALLAAKTVGYTSGPSGVYMAQLVERMGIADAVKAKHRGVPSGGTIGSIVATGEAEIGFQQISELVHIGGIDVVGPLPAEIQCITRFCCGVHSGAKNPDGARALARFLAAPARLPVMKKHGLEPA
ncbi:MAG: ABC transporter substrate-binding protein [Alphaproteobacteria bacterium]|nr:ABC transporter substrate-binding protein [Alphaproteobacteria bacterium]